MGPLGPGGFRRRGRRRGLVVGAAVGAAAAHHGNKRADEAYDQGAADAAPVAQAAPAAPSMDDEMAQLEKLGQLKDQGILTQEEFDAKKKQILGL